MMTLPIKRNVLVVDDDQMLRETYMLLMGETFNVTTSGSPEEAFSVIDSGSVFDAVVVDYDMKSTLDGVDIALHAREKYPHIPIIMATGRGEQNTSRMEQLKSIPNCALLTKPFSHIVLERILISGDCTVYL